MEILIKHNKFKLIIIHKIKVLHIRIFRIILKIKVSKLTIHKII